MQCSLQWTDAVCPGSGDDAGLTRLVSSQDEVGWSQQLSVSQQSLGTFIAKRNHHHLHKDHVSFFYVCDIEETNAVASYLSSGKDKKYTLV